MYNYDCSIKLVFSTLGTIMPCKCVFSTLSSYSVFSYPARDKVALLIGNQRYSGCEKLNNLKCIEKEVASVAQKLRDLNFKVHTYSSCVVKYTTPIRFCGAENAFYNNVCQSVVGERP